MITYYMAQRYVRSASDEILATGISWMFLTNVHLSSLEHRTLESTEQKFCNRVRSWDAGESNKPLGC